MVAARGMRATLYIILILYHQGRLRKQFIAIVMQIQKWTMAVYLKYSLRAKDYDYCGFGLRKRKVNYF